MQGFGTKTLACVVAAAGFAGGLGVSYYSIPKVDAVAQSPEFRGNRKAAAASDEDKLRSAIPTAGPKGGGNGSTSRRGALAAAGDASGNLLTDRIRNYVRVIMAAEPEEYPELMLEAMRELGDDGPFSDMVLPILAQQWVKADPVGAFEAVYSGKLSSMVSGSFSHEVFNPVLEQALDADLAAVREIVLASSHLKSARGTLEKIVQKESLSSLEEAFATLDRIKSPGMRASALTKLFDYQINRNSPGEALATLAKYPGMTINGNSLLKAYAGLASKDLESALETAEQLGSASHRRLALQGIAEQWAKTDRDAALAHIDSISSPAVRSEMLSKLNLATFKTDPETAAMGALEIPSRRKRDDTIKEIAWNWYRQDKADTVAWMDANLDQTSWETAAGAIVGNKIDYREFEAVTSLVDRLPSDHANVQQFIQQWKSHDSEGLETWIGKQPVNRQNELRKVLSKAESANQSSQHPLQSPGLPQNQRMVEAVAIDPLNGAEVRHQYIVNEDDVVIREINAE